MLKKKRSIGRGWLPFISKPKLMQLHRCHHCVVIIFKYKQRMILIIRKGHSSLYWLSLWNGSSPWESENVFEKKKKLQGWWDWPWLQLVVFKLLHNNIILADQMAGILFFKALKSKKDSYILILRPQTSISRCASLTGLACIVALAILTNVTSLFEYKTKVQVNFLRFIFLGTPQLFPSKKIKVWHKIYYRRTWLSKGRVLFGERFLFQQTKVQERPLGDISWSCLHTCAWTPFISRLQINYFLLIY